METILELFKRRVNQLGPRPALWYKQEGSWEHQSWKEWWEQAERVAAGLIERGLEPHEPVCILAQTRIEWAWIDLGIWMAGGFVVPIYPTSRPEECRHILDEVGARFAFVENPSQLDKIADAASMEHMVYLERAAALPGGDWKGRHQVRLEDLEEGDAERAVSFDELSYEGRRRIADDHRFVATRRNAVSYDDLATVVYTSGTSGVPKGVEHTQGGLRAELAAIAELDLIGPDDRQLLFLPLAHIFARILFLSSLATASQVAFAESLSKTVANIAEVRPEFVAGVPRVFEKIREELIAESERLFGPNTTVWERAFRRGRLFSQKQRKGQDLGPLERLELKLYERLVFERVKRVFGGNIQYLFCGGAPLRAELAEFYHAMGLLVLEGYGLTETAAVSTLNLPDDFRFGSVGKPLPNVEVTIDEDGEILVRGPMVMRGYYDRPELTRETVESDESWFHTGD
ncbi:MAG: AMP-dependent synthetase/ligase, partial [Persicimonas sp.]